MLFLLPIASPSWVRAEDDRALFRATNAKPNVFFMIDISSSMHRDTNSERTPASGDDPHSRLYLAKRAAYEVIDIVGDSVNYGWATFNREKLILRRKHWLYKPKTLPSFYDSSSFPVLPLDRPVIFGEPRHRKNSELADRTNAANDATLIDDSQKFYRHRECGDPTTTPDKILDFAKLGHAGDYKTEIHYFRGVEYRITFMPLDPDVTEMGAAEMPVEIRIDELTGTCADGEAGYTNRHTETVTFVPYYADDLDPKDPYSFNGVPDYISYNRSGNDTGGFVMDDYQVTTACNASRLDRPGDPDDGEKLRWDGNFDNDVAQNDVVTYDVLADPYGRGDALSRGDVIPWDWKRPWEHPASGSKFSTSNREEILLRLAPNLSQAGETIPEFRVAPYFEDVPVGPSTDLRLPIKDAYVERPPIMAASGTPIAGSLRSVSRWYEEWEKVASNPDPEIGDPALQCRDKFVILLTDGAESCEGGSLFDPASDKRTKPCEAADALYKQGIRTFVVAFGASDEEVETLECIADEGGTGAGEDTDEDGEIDDPGFDKDEDGEPDGPGPISADNKDDLVEALLKIFNLVRPESAAISAAAVPSVQADVADKIYLTEFTPVDASSVWPGSLQSFVKPLPFTDSGLPDTSLKCSPSKTSGCLAWDAQHSVVENQVKGTESDPLGFAANQRRIFYSKFRADDGSTQQDPDESVPRQRRFLDPIALGAGTPPPAAYDLWRAFGIDFVSGDADSEAHAALLSEQAIEGTVGLREAVLPDGSRREYVIGDFFHSDPVVVNAPSNTNYFLQDLEGDPSVSCEAGDPKSYRCFALRHQFRRKILYIGSNAGMLHAIDAGSYQIPGAPDLVDQGTFDNGTGQELFAYMPRPVMPTVLDLNVEDPVRHKYTVDGPPTAADVFIDPIHSGQFSSTDRPDPDQRQWRTVLLGGLRRGGDKSGDRRFSFGDILDPDVVRPDPTDPDLETDIQLTSGYYLLDITQPDLVETDLLPGGRNDRDGDNKVDIWVPKSAANPPACVLSDADGGGDPTHADCGDLPFGTPLWEFLDLMVDGYNSSLQRMPPIRLDEDDNGFVDLGFSWSKAVIGRLRVCTGTQCDPEDPDQVASGEQEDRYVAVFGGGWDPLHPHLRGNWIYMVDIETGQAIYKQAVEGSVPASPTVLPTQDGYIDRIYFGTTQGFVYRLDMRPETSAGDPVLPRLEAGVITERVADPNNGLVLTDAVEPVRRIYPFAIGAETYFSPVKLFDANGPDPQQIFLGISAFLVADLGEYGLAFGTGNRDDLFREDDIPGRFVVFVDDFTGPELRDPGFTPLTVTALQEVSDSYDGSGTNALLERAEGQRGWYIDLRDDERLVGDPLVISGLLFFSTFRPLTSELVEDEDKILCSAAGLGRAYGMLLTNGEGVLADADGNLTTDISIKGLITAPFAEQSQTKNPSSGSKEDEPDEVTPQLESLMEELRALFPANCTFPPGYRLDIKVRNQDTGLTFVIPVPMCVIESSFREF